MMLKKIIALGLTALFMTACGSSDSDGVSSSRGSGECVDMSMASHVGLTVRSKVTFFPSGITSIFSDKLESFTKSSSKILRYDDKENLLGSIESKYYMSDGYLKQTNIKFKGFSVPDYELMFDPYGLSLHEGKVCKGDSHEYKYDTYIKHENKEKEFSSNTNIKYTVEDINIEKTVTAGTFNTIKLSYKDQKDNSIEYIWTDIDTYSAILSEAYDKDGKLIRKVESLDIY